MRLLPPSLNLASLFALMVALAVLFAPAMSRGEALAAVPSHDMQMMVAGHCHSPVSNMADHHERDMSCCNAASIGVEAAIAVPPAQVEAGLAPASLPVPVLHRPFLGELATPPPRSA